MLNNYKVLNMRNLIFIIIILNCIVSFGQKKKSNKMLVPPKILKIEEEPIPEEKCFVYKFEVPKDSLIFESTNLLEYGWSGENARIVIKTVQYDPIKEKKAKEEGYDLIWERTLQYINGKFKIEKNILTFTPEKLNAHKIQTFKLIYKAKSKDLDYLIDENGKKYIVGKCSEPTIEM